MVDQTPVLDIKPYIPQYDNPGLSNIYYAEENLPASGDGVNESESATFSRDSLMNSITEQASTSNIVDSLDSLNVRVMDGEENGRRDHALGSPATENILSRTEESFYGRLRYFMRFILTNCAYWYNFTDLIQG